MKFEKLMPMLRSHRLEQSIAFYCEKRRFICTNRAPDWAFVERDQVLPMIALPNAHEPFDQPGFSGSFYFTVDDVNALWQQLKDQVPVVYPIETFEYEMREFAIRDISGYCLQFG